MINNNNLSISDVVSNAWRYFRANWQRLILLNFVLCAFLGINESLFNWSIESSSRLINENAVDSMEFLDDASVLNILIMLLMWIILFLFYTVMNSALNLSYQYELLKLVDEGETPKIELFSCLKFDLIFNLIIGYIIIGFFVTCGFICFIIPAFYISIRLSCFQLILLEQEKPNFMEAIKKSWEMTRGHVISIFVLNTIGFFIVLIGILACFIGVLAAAPLASLISIFIYTALRKKIINHNSLDNNIIVEEL